MRFGSRRIARSGSSPRGRSRRATSITRTSIASPGKRRGADAMTRPIAIDSARLQRWIDDLAGLSEASPPAVTRVLFSEVDLAARAWVKQRCAEEGLTVREDAVGNIFARWSPANRATGGNAGAGAGQ